MNSSSSGNQHRSLHEVVGATGFASLALEVIQRAPKAGDAAEMLEILAAANHVFGAEMAVFVSFIRDDESRESFRFLVAGNPAWCIAYQQNGWYANDAWLLYAATNSEPVSDTAIPLRTRWQRAARALATQHGAVSAYVVPAPASGGLSRLGLLVLGSAQSQYFDSPAAGTIKVFARSLAMEIHEWWVRQIRKEIIASNRITDDDLRLLALERRGLRTKQIADELNVSPASVDSRFQRLNAKFNRPNRRATANLAAEYGLIEPCGPLN